VGRRGSPVGRRIIVALQEADEGGLFRAVTLDVEVPVLEFHPQRLTEHSILVGDHHLAQYQERVREILRITLPTPLGALSGGASSPSSWCGESGTCECPKEVMGDELAATGPSGAGW